MLKANQQTYKKFQEYFKVKTSPSEIENKLWKKVYRYTPILHLIPWVLFVWVGNSLSMNACHEDSDIDLFIITRKNRLWTVRILTTLYFTILGQRKTAKKHAGKFCLSFFITEDALDFWEFAIKNDVYLYFWILYLKPIIDKENTYEQFLQVQKSWADFSEYEEISEKNKEYILHTSSKISTHCKIWDVLETFFKALFLPKTKKSFQKLGRPFWVIISDDILKFHDNDRRKEVRDILF